MNLRGQADRNGINTRTWKFLEIFKTLRSSNPPKKLLAHVKKYLDFALLNRVIWHVEFFFFHACWTYLGLNMRQLWENCGKYDSLGKFQFIKSLGVLIRMSCCNFLAMERSFHFKKPLGSPWQARCGENPFRHD